MSQSSQGSQGSMRVLASLAILAALVVAAPLVAQDVKVDLSKETVGKAPTTFEPQMGMWVVAQDGPDKVIKVDGVAFKASLDTPTRLLLDNARKLYGTTNEELMDNAKQFTTFPIAVMRNSPEFSDGTISVKFKTVSGNADRASGILFNVKPNGDWLCVRYNDTEDNVALWTFHGDGIRRNVKFSDRAHPPLLDRDEKGTIGARSWHELKMTVAGADFKTWVDGQLRLEYTFGTDPTRANANQFLFPKNNPTLTPPIMGKVGLWSKTDSTVEFKDYVIAKAK